MKRSIVLYTEGLNFSGDTLEKKALGGSETAFIQLARELARAGHTVDAFCPCPRPGVFHDVTYHDLSAFEDWRSHASCDLFICSRFFHVFFKPIRARTRILWNHDAFDLWQFELLARCIHEIDHVYCLSEHHLDHFARHLPHHRDKLSKTHNGLDFETIHAATEGVEKKHQILFTSRPERGLLNALDLYEALDDRTLAFRHGTYDYPWKNGGVDQAEAACEKRMQALRDQGFPVVSEAWSKPELYAEMAAGKVVLHPTETPEVFCLSAAEAQACQTIYLAPDHSAFKEVVAYPGLDPTNRTLAFRHGT
ncbi:MAG: glycosyltransferase, partial [Verrucomicrobiota bacterium]